MASPSRSIFIPRQEKINRILPMETLERLVEAGTKIHDKLQKLPKEISSLYLKQFSMMVQLIDANKRETDGRPETRSSLSGPRTSR
jgi:hypothetical protein